MTINNKWCPGGCKELYMYVPRWGGYVTFAIIVICRGVWLNNCIVQWLCDDTIFEENILHLSNASSANVIGLNMYMYLRGVHANVHMCVCLL